MLALQYKYKLIIMSKFEIDFFELLFLAEVCKPPRPIARAMFWQDLCDKHYHTMSENERLKMYDFLNKDLNLSLIHI